MVKSLLLGLFFHQLPLPSFFLDTSAGPVTKQQFCVVTHSDATLHSGVRRAHIDKSLTRKPVLRRASKLWSQHLCKMEI